MFKNLSYLYYHRVFSNVFVKKNSDNEKIETTIYENVNCDCSDPGRCQWICLKQHTRNLEQ